MILSKRKSIVLSTILGMSLSICINADLSHAQENNATTKSISQLQADLSSIISDIKIIDKEEIYMGNDYVKVSVAVKDENIDKITLNNNEGELYKSDESNRFEGKIKFQKSKDAYRYKVQELTIHYKNGDKVVFNRDASSEEILKQFDFDIKLNTIKEIRIESKGKLYVGDVLEISVKLNGDHGGVLGVVNHRNTEFILLRYTEGALMRPGETKTVCLTYNEDKKIFEGGDIIDDYELGINMIEWFYVADYVKVDNNMLKQGNYCVSEYDGLKNIKIVDKKNIDTNTDIKFRAEATGVDKIDYITVKYDGGPYDYNKIEYRLDKKEDNIYEGSGKLPEDRKNYKFKSIEIHRSNGNVIVYDELPFKWNLNIDDEIKTGWIKKDNEWYYFDSNQEVVTGWLNLNGTWYYLKKDGVMATGWGYIDNKWYYLEKSGTMAANKWVSEDTYTWYYLENNGVMATGWQQINGAWHYLKPSGEMARYWQQINGTWYYLKYSGEMATGWQKISGKWYYFYSSGAMAKNTTVNGYKINSNGVAVNKK